MFTNSGRFFYLYFFCWAYALTSIGFRLTVAKQPILINASIALFVTGFVWSLASLVRLVRQRNARNPSPQIMALIEQIRDAFRDVRLGNGVSLREANVIDDYGTEAERADARRQDELDDWTAVPDEQIDESPDALHFLDNEGRHYYLPAFMVFALRYHGKRSSRSPETLLNQLGNVEKTDELRSLISPRQCDAVVAFLDHMRAEADDADEAHHLELAKAYWQGDVDAGQALRQREEAIQNYAAALAAGFEKQKQQQGVADTSQLTNEEVTEMLLKVLADTPPPRTSTRATEERIDGAFSRPLPNQFDFMLQDLAGNRRTLKELQGARATVVDFWGTWCPPCRMSIPHLIKLHRERASEGVQVIGITYEEGTPADYLPKLKHFAEKVEISYPLLLDDNRVGSQLPDFGALPTVLFLDAQGTPRAMVIGYTDPEILNGIVERVLSS
ncbi:MAG: hypothetical protein RIS70_3904 [Planctomycetota bacterium]